MSHQLVTRATIEQIEGSRAQAIGFLNDAAIAITKAHKAVGAASGGRGMNLDDRMRARLLGRDEDRESFLTEARRSIDRSIWTHLISGYGFEKLMDRQAHDEFRAQLERDPPEISTENTQATLSQLILDADRIFRRGIANAFSSLDRRFRSHDGFKVGERIVLANAFSEGGTWNHHRRCDETIRDIERVLYRLDEREMPERHCGLVGLIDAARSHRYERSAFLVEDEYFRFRAFKNGNAHLWFKRDDLLRRINLLLAEHYGAVIGARTDACEDDPLSRPGRSMARNLGWFPTPRRVVDRMMDEAGLAYVSRGDVQQLRILEPSAGEGAICRGIRASLPASGITAHLTAVEFHPGRAETLRDGGVADVVVNRDFLDLDPNLFGPFDRILMNPPFDRQSDVDHIAHAARFLAPGGILIAISSAGVEFRQDAKAIAFRALVERMSGEMRDLPPGSFEESGTMVNTCMITMRAPAAARH